MARKKDWAEITYAPKLENCCQAWEFFFLHPKERWKGAFAQSVPGQFYNEFDRSVSEPRRASSGIGKSRKPLTDARHYALFEFEINKPNSWLIPKLWWNRHFPNRILLCYLTRKLQSAQVKTISGVVLYVIAAKMLWGLMGASATREARKQN